MQTEDFQKFHECIAGVMSFYEKSVSTFALDIGWHALTAYDLATMVDAFNRHLVNPDVGQFPPKPADINRMLQGSTQEPALCAGAKVDQAEKIIEHGRSQGCSPSTCCPRLRPSARRLGIKAAPM